MSSVLDSAEYLMLIFKKKLLSGPRWWAPKGRGPWCTAPLAPPVWPPLCNIIHSEDYQLLRNRLSTDALSVDSSGDFRPSYSLGIPLLKFRIMPVPGF